MVSRWERAAVQARQRGRRSRGACSPSREWRKFLAAFARRRGCLDVAAAFEEPFFEWKSVLLNAEERRLLTLFEIVLLSKPAAPDAWPEVLPWKAYEQLVQAIEDAADCLKKNHGKKFSMIGTKFPPMRWAATTLTDEQKATWIHETDPRAGKAVDQQSRSTDLVIRKMDGRVEVQKDEARKEDTRGKAKSTR
jgi:hypothetical protein